MWRWGRITRIAASCVARIWRTDHFQFEWFGMVQPCRSKPPEWGRLWPLWPTPLGLNRIPKRPTAFPRCPSLIGRLLPHNINAPICYWLLFRSSFLSLCPPPPLSSSFLSFSLLSVLCRWWFFSWSIVSLSAEKNRGRRRGSIFRSSHQLVINLQWLILVTAINQERWSVSDER